MSLLLEGDAEIVAVIEEDGQPAQAGYSLSVMLGSVLSPPG